MGAFRLPVLGAGAPCQPRATVGDAHAEPGQLALRLGGSLVVAGLNGFLEPGEPVDGPVGDRRLFEWGRHGALLRGQGLYLSPPVARFVASSPTWKCRSS